LRASNIFSPETEEDRHGHYCDDRRNQSGVDSWQANAQRERGWRNLRLLSSADNGFNRDYHGEDDEGAQWPALNVFARRGAEVHHMFCSELLFAPTDPGQNARHVDMIWPLWNLFDFTPEGRGTDWYPALEYES
jgi:predicted dithiol-disulfide oxidoreductase (DUF899 family)